MPAPVDAFRVFTAARVASFHFPKILKRVLCDT